MQAPQRPIEMTKMSSGRAQIPFPLRHLPFADPFPRSLQLAWLGGVWEIA